MLLPLFTQDSTTNLNLIQRETWDFSACSQLADFILFYVQDKLYQKTHFAKWLRKKLQFSLSLHFNTYTLNQNVWSSWPIYEVKCLCSRGQE